MSTATATQNGFAKSGAEEKPKLYCVGIVDSVKEPHVSESGNYVVQPIEISALGVGLSQTLYWLYRPEWLRPGFDPETLKDAENGKALYFVYQKNINTEGSLSNLRGLCGSEEAFTKLANEILALEDDGDTGGPSMEDVANVLTTFFENNTDESGEQVRVGYALRQQRVKTGEIDENGRAKKILGGRYEIDKFFDPTPKALDRYKKAAERSGGKSKFTYEFDAF